MCLNRRRLHDQKATLPEWIRIRVMRNGFLIKTPINQGFFDGIWLSHHFLISSAHAIERKSVLLRMNDTKKILISVKGVTLTIARVNPISSINSSVVVPFKKTSLLLKWAQAEQRFPKSPASATHLVRGRQARASRIPPFHLRGLSRRRKPWDSEKECW